MVLLIKYLVRLWKRRQANNQATASPGASSRTSGEPSDDASPPSDDAVPLLASGELRHAAGTSPVKLGPLALLAHQARYDLLISWRNPRARFMGFFFPIVLLVVFTGVFGRGTTRVDGVTVKLSVFYVSGILAMAVVVNAYAGLVILISNLRETGVLKRRRATPVPAVLLICGQAIATVVSTAATATVLLVIAKLFFGVGMSAPSLAAVTCTTLVGTAAFACIGYAVAGLIGNPEAAQPVVQMTMLPLWFISGVFIPVSQLSKGIKTVGDIFPVQYLANGFHLASVHSSFAAALSLKDLLVLAGWAVLGTALALWRFSWLPSAAA